jgi:CBS domain-containing protein
MGYIRLGSKPPLEVRPDATVTEIALAMTGRKVGAAGVVEDGKVVGVVTERDVLGKVVATGRDPNATPVRDIMSSPALCVELKTSVADAAAVMRKHHIRHLVVVDEQGRFVAMLALRYLLYEMMDDMHRNVADLVGFIMADSPGG